MIGYISNSTTSIKYVSKVTLIFEISTALLTCQNGYKTLHYDVVIELSSAELHIRKRKVYSIKFYGNKSLISSLKCHTKVK